jgi:P4 family phage/plasmid primase-like protien
MAKLCGDCKFYFDKDKCERAEYKSNRRNREVYEAYNYKICELFQSKKRKNNEDLDMGEALQLLNDKFIFKCPTDTRTLLGYNDGHYIPFETRVHETLEEAYGENLKSHFVEETIKHLQRANYVERTQINRFSNKIPVQNGLLHLLIRTLEPFNPEEIFTYKLNVEYDPLKECPEWLKFLGQILRPEDIPLLQEIMGYCLLPEMPFHKLFWFYGTGRNGKDRVIMTLENILGEDNVSHLNLGEFRETRRFSLCQLYGKLVNISNEPESKYAISTNILKLISGENTIHAELKNKNDRLGFINKAKTIIVGNSFPKVEDNSTGFWERVEVLNFPFSFIGKDAVPNIERKWLPSEVSAILNWMLDGLYRLREQGQFSTSKTIEETKAEFMRVSDPFRAWLNDCCTLLSEAYLTRQEAYDSYKNYAEELGATANGPRTFYNKMRQTPRIKDTQIRVKGKPERVFQGVALKTELDEDQSKLESVPDVPDRTGVSYSLANNEFSKNIENKELKEPGTSGTSGTVGIPEKHDGKYPICFICHRSIPLLQNLSNIEGKPAHKQCIKAYDEDRL